MINNLPNSLTNQKMLVHGLRFIGRDCVMMNCLRTYLTPTSNKKSKAILTPLLHYRQLGLTRVFSSASSPNVNVEEQNRGLSDSPLALSIIDSLQKLDLDKDEIKQIIEKQPSLVNYATSNWRSVIKLLLDSNMPKDSVYKMLEKCPELLTISTSNLHKGLMVWFGSGMSQGLYIEILTEHPSFLKLDPQYVRKRIKQFQLHLEGKNRTGRLFLIAPTTMTQNIASITDKINYLDELCKDKEELVMSGVLDFDLFHIMARHEFLIRAGLYKRPTKNYDKRLDKNPKLEKIMNSSDKDFVSNLTPLSFIEYEVFLEMYKKQLDDGNESDSDDDENYLLSYKKHQDRQKKRKY